MVNSMGKARRVPPGNLVLICEACDYPVSGDVGYLTVNGRRWRIYHDKCAVRHNVTPGVLPGANGVRPCQVRASEIATAEQLLTVLAALAGRGPKSVGIDGTDWLQLVRRIVADTDWYFATDGANGGRKTAQELASANQEVYASAGFGQQSNVKGAEANA